MLVTALFDGPVYVCLQVVRAHGFQVSDGDRVSNVHDGLAMCLRIDVLVISILCVLAARPLDSMAAYEGILTVRFCISVLFISRSIAVAVRPISVASLAASLLSSASLLDSRKVS